MSYIGSKPANKPVVASDIDPTMITGQTALAVAPAATDEFLISDAGVLKRLDASLIESAAMTEVDQWRLTTDLSCSTANTNTTVTANLERNDTAGFDKIGTGMSESSGIFTFPSTGVWRVEVLFYFYSSSGGSAYNALNIWTTLDDSSYTQQTDVSVSTSTAPKRNVGYGTTLFDVTDASNCKVKFMYYCEGTLNLQGDSTKNETHFVFSKLANT